jgi:hypothetical protein
MVLGPLGPDGTVKAMKQFHDLQGVPGILEVVKDLGHPLAGKARGAQFVLDFAHAPPPAGVVRTLEGFEVVDSLPGVGGRRYDLLVREGADLVRYEFKNWSQFPPRPGSAYFKALRQMRFDAALFTLRNTSLTNLRWVFPASLTEVEKTALQYTLRRSMIEDVMWLDELEEAGVSASDADTTMRTLLKLLDEGKLVSFH